MTFALRVTSNVKFAARRARRWITAVRGGGSPPCAVVDRRFHGWAVSWVVGNGHLPQP
jgi:hypothetical protein